MSPPTMDAADKLASYDVRDRGDFAAHALSDATVRPDKGGRQGKAITVATNNYEVKFFKELSIKHFDVTIAPMTDRDGEIKPAPKTDRPLPSPIMMEVWKMVLDKWTELTPAQRVSVVFDGRKNAMTAADLPFDESSVQIELQPKPATPGSAGRPIRRRLFQVTVRRVNRIDGSVLTQFIRGDRATILAAGTAYTDKLAIVLQALNLAIRADAIQQYRQHGAGGRRFFDPATAMPISGGAEIWRGFFQSMLPLQGGLMLNLDVAFSCFSCSGPLMEVAAKILQMGGGGGSGRGGRGGRGGGRGGRGFGGGSRGDYGGASHQSGPPMLMRLDAHEQQVLRKRLYNASIIVTHRPNGKAERFKGFTPTSAQTCEFRRDSDGAMITIAKYFLQTYNVQLRHPHLPCAIIGQGRTCIPMEFCQVLPGSPIPPQRMLPEQTQDMIKQSAQPPPNRKQDTQRWRDIRAYEQNESLKGWGLQVNNNMQQVQARVLPSPTVAYANGAMRDPPRFGAWNLRGQRFVVPGKALLTLVVINFTRTPDHVVQQFVDMLLRTLASHGMSVQVRQPKIFQGAPDPESVKNIMTQSGREVFAAGQKRCPPQLFLLVLEGSNTMLYDKIKKVAGAELPFSTATQCVNARKAFNDRGQDQYCSNVAMKINIKMGGSNQSVIGPQDLPRLGDGTMMIGLDVSHPPPGMDRPSIVAAISTTNGRGTKFWGELMAQSNPRQGKAQEAILQGRALFVKLLQAWMAQNQGKPPSNIIIFRDGVSQGEYSAVAENEIVALEEACKQKSLGGGGYRPKIAFIVGTKRHRVRFFATTQSDMDRSGNLPAGTVVDSGVTHPYAFDFYLQAQAGLVGTARPAHYIVLRDTIGFSSDELERLVNSLCYTYQRATRAVSQVPIAKYAHCLAEKGTAMLNADSNSDIGSTISGRSAEGSTHSSAIFDEMMAKMSAAPASGNANLNTFAETLWFM